MSVTNTDQTFGVVTRLIHWVMALGIIAMLGFGTYLANMTVNMSNFHLFAWHKSVGLLLLALALTRLIWHRVTSPPNPKGGVPAWQMRLAKGTHIALYLLMVAVPLTGWIASSATGIDVLFFGITLPHIAPASEAWEDGFFLAHTILTKVLFVLVILHIAGAVKRRDGTILRMIKGTH